MMNLPRQNSAWVDGDGRPTRDLYNWARQITVQPQTGAASSYALGDLTNVRLSSISDGDVLTWSNTQGRWINSASSFGYINLPRTTSGLEVGKCFSTSAGFTVNTATEGDIYSVYNNSGSNITLAQGGGLTLRVAGSSTTGNYILPQRGFVTIWYNSATEAIIL